MQPGGSSIWGKQGLLFFRRELSFRSHLQPGNSGLMTIDNNRNGRTVRAVNDCVDCVRYLTDLSDPQLRW